VWSSRPAGAPGRPFWRRILISGNTGLAGRLFIADCWVPQAPPATEAAAVNGTYLLFVIVDMSAITKPPRGELPGDADAALRQLYMHHARALHSYVERFCPDQASADDIVQETYIRAWRHLQQLSADDRPIRPWLFRVARNLLIDADRAARARPMTVRAPWAEDGWDEPQAEDARDDSGLDQVLDRELVSAALRHLSPAHRTVLVETFYNGGTLATVARQLGIPHGTARSRLHYALQALRQQLQERDAIACW
jgi:RNA polymerase sigma-70 factor, ECF subfamily